MGINEELSLLGRDSKYKYSYSPEILECFSNPHPENDYWVNFNCPEFTSLCPITGQPDFASIHIRYLPAQKMVESKSLKFPKYIEVEGIFTPRGGISIYPFCNYGEPDTKYEEMANYRLLNHSLNK